MKQQQTDADFLLGSGHRPAAAAPVCDLVHLTDTDIPLDSRGF
jgi:Cys-tRNA synthase (O-phospho-L-seryl-tRNA:Cys-tRNA synthase)